MKLRVPAAILGACMLLSANGCSFLELGLDDALRPPKTMGDEAEIEKLISESAKGSYILKYPKNGNYRSAIITKDLDGDDTPEAIAFFRGKDETTRLHMLVMHETGDGRVQGLLDLLLRGVGIAHQKILADGPAEERIPLRDIDEVAAGAGRSLIFLLTAV